MEWIDEKTLLLSKKLNELDKLLLKFVKVLGKYSEYVVVYGYVAILFGRARATEDIDILVKDMDQENFEKFWREIHKSFWCLNAENSEDAFRVLGGD
jgi:hypothetical protein